MRVNSCSVLATKRGDLKLNWVCSVNVYSDSLTLRHTVMSTFNIIPQSSTRLCVFNVCVYVGNINFGRNGKNSLAEQTGKQMT